MPDLPEKQALELRTGKRIAWREWGAGRPLVLLHGWSMSSAVFAEVAVRLAENYRVICPDLPGCGDSDPTENCDLESYSAAIAEWLVTLGVADYCLLGWSLGGQVALCLSGAAVPPRSLVLVATTPLFCQTTDWAHGLPDTQLKSLKRNLGRAYEKTMGDFFQLQFVSEELPTERLRQILKFSVRQEKLPDPRLAIESLKILAEADLRSALANINIRTLILHGQLDQIIPWQAGAYLADQLPNADFIRLANVGHAPFFSRPDTCVELWLDFLHGE